MDISSMEILREAKGKKRNSQNASGKYCGGLRVKWEFYKVLENSWRGHVGRALYALI